MLCTAKQIAEIFQVSERTIKRWQLEMGMPFHKFENTVRYDREEIVEWFKTREVKK